MNRDTFLNNIRRSLDTALLPESRPERPAAPVLEPFDPPALVPGFVQEAEALSAEVHQAASTTDAFEMLASLFARYEANSYLAWDDLPLGRLEKRLLARGYERRLVRLPAGAEPRLAALNSIRDVTIGLTGSLGGLADTGSIVVQSGQGQGRLASLITPVHIAFLQRNQLYPSMAHFWQAHPNQAALSSNLVFISGPSRTADIEQTLTIGVHGPKYLHIILL